MNVPEGNDFYASSIWLVEHLNSKILTRNSKCNTVFLVPLLNDECKLITFALLTCFPHSVNAITYPNKIESKHHD